MRRWLRRHRAARPMTCAEAAQVLQRYLDGEVDDLTARRVHEHLEMCRRCGLEAQTYRAIKDAVARGGLPVERDVLDRLRQFGERLAEEGPADEAGSSA